MHKRLFFFSIAGLVLVAGCFVQFVFLPMLMPALHAGEGLIAGGDWHAFHLVARERAWAIELYGWTEWQLRPNGHLPAGIASALYALFKPALWIMLPVNAVCWGLTGLLCARIARPYVASDRAALFCALPGVLTPGAFLFLTQMHKDVFFIPAMLMLWLGVAAWARALSATHTDASERALRRAAWRMVGGLTLAWLTRPYVAFLLALGAAGAMGLALLMEWRPARRSLPARIRWQPPALMLGILLLTGMLARMPAAHIYTLTSGAAATLSTIPSSAAPSWLEKPFRILTGMRTYYLHSYPGAETAIDEHRSLSSAAEVIAYIPRALVIFFLEPLPSAWRKALADGGLFTRLASAETAARYALWVGLPLLFWRYRHRGDLWFPLVVFLPFVVILTIVTPNLGTLHRLRLFLMVPLNTLATAGWLLLLARHRKKPAAARPLALSRRWWHNARGRGSDTTQLMSRSGHIYAFRRHIGYGGRMADGGG